MKISAKVLSVLLMVLLYCMPIQAAEQVLFYHTDPAGTPLAMTNSSGAVVWKADYKPFGEEQSVIATSPNDKRFVGKEKDEETGLSYFGARYENAKIGRFIAPDPVRAVDEKTSKTNEKMLLNPQRLNTYAYALNNPCKYIDPDGRAPLLSAEDSVSNGKVLIGGGGIKNVSDGTMSARSSGGGSVGGATGVNQIDPFSVRFSQNNAAASFKGGSNITELATGLRSGTISPESVPPIRLVERDGQMFTLDNRRLEAFRRAGVQVPYRMATQSEAATESWKFTTRNNGVSIKIRGEK